MSFRCRSICLPRLSILNLPNLVLAEHTWNVSSSSIPRLRSRKSAFIASTLQSVMSVPESSDQGLSFLEPDIQTRLLYHGWEGSMTSNGTYHPIMLPPYNRLNSKEEAQAWVAKITRILTSPEPDLDMRSALDYPFNSNDGKGHLILSEFAPRA